jgi:hypothetical protein
MRFCDGEKEHTKPEKGKPKTHPHKTEGGAPSAWLRVVLTLRFVLADRFSRKKEPSKSSGPPAKVVRATRPKSRR